MVKSTKPVTQSNIEGDDEDNLMSAAADILEKSIVEQASSPAAAGQGKPTKKRKLPEQPAGGKKKKEDDFTTALKLQLEQIDPKKQLSIHELLHYKDTDPVVKEYLELICTIGFIPSQPKETDFESLDHSKLTPVSSACSTTLTHLLFTLFQSRYFRNNSLDAAIRKKSIFNVQPKMYIPDFKDLPEHFLHKMTEVRQAVSLNLQGLAVEGSDFIAELLKLRCANVIISDCTTEKVKEKSPIAVEKDKIQQIFDVHYLKCQIEFFKAYPLKSIDWDSYENKTKHIEPLWRQAQSVNPETVNFYANSLVYKISTNAVSFQAETVKAEYKHFLENTDEYMCKLKNKRSPTKESPSQASTSNPMPSVPNQHGNTPSYHRSAGNGNYKYANKRHNHNQHFPPGHNSNLSTGHRYNFRNNQSSNFSPGHNPNFSPGHNPNFSFGHNPDFQRGQDYNFQRGHTNFQRERNSNFQQDRRYDSNYHRGRNQNYYSVPFNHSQTGSARKFQHTQNKNFNYRQNQNHVSDQNDSQRNRQKYGNFVPPNSKRVWRETENQRKYNNQQKQVYNGHHNTRTTAPAPFRFNPVNHNTKKTYNFVDASKGNMSTDPFGLEPPADNHHQSQGQVVAGSKLDAKQPSSSRQHLNRLQ